MDLYDILIAKKLAGDGGGGGGGDVETATIVITVINGTATITSGEFPEWCYAGNAEHIYGRAITNDTEDADSEWAFLGMEPMGSYDLLFFFGFGGNLGVAKDLSLIAISSGGEPVPITNGTINITLIYMPN